MQPVWQAVLHAWLSPIHQGGVDDGLGHLTDVCQRIGNLCRGKCRRVPSMIVVAVHGAGVGRDSSFRGS